MTEPILISADNRTQQIVAASSASVGVDVVTTLDAQTAREHWATARVVLIDVGSAHLVARAGLPSRAGLYLCGTDSDDLLSWSVPLNASVILLPDQSAFLSAVLAAPHAQVGSRPAVVEVLSGSGGVGASTFAAGLAVRIARSGRQVALLECDPFGGGIDFLCGIDDVAGWRWNDLRCASGHVPDLGQRLPSVEGVTVVSQSWADEAPGEPVPPSAMSSVMSSLGYSHDVIVSDSGHQPMNINPTRTVMLVAATVKSVMAARAKIMHFGISEPILVVRTLKSGLDPGRIAESLSLPVAATVPTDRGIYRDYAVGKPPGLSKGPLTRACDAVVEVVGRG